MGIVEKVKGFVAGAGLAAAVMLSPVVARSDDKKEELFEFPNGDKARWCPYDSTEASMQYLSKTGEYRDITILTRRFPIGVEGRLEWSYMRIRTLTDKDGDKKVDVISELYFMEGGHAPVMYSWTREESTHPHHQAEFESRDGMIRVGRECLEGAFNLRKFREDMKKREEEYKKQNLSEPF